MDSRVPAQIRSLLADYLALMENELPGFLTGFYLHGSIALNAFQPDLSDIDFVAFVSRPSTEGDVEVLRTIHLSIAAKHSECLLEGSYLQWEALGQLEASIAPGPVHHDNKLEGAGKFDVNSVTWWVLKHHGITLVGPPVSNLAFEVDWELLIANMHENLNSYWHGFTRKPARIAWLFTDFGIEWTVLGVLRQYYTFVEQGITSKTGAGEYALTHLPAKWHRLIREAIRIRQRTSGSVFKSSYRSSVLRAVEAYKFLQFVIQTSNLLFQ